jgi:molybdopterin converting factor small subunit
LIKVTLLFKSHYQDWFGINEYEMFVESGTTIRNVMSQLMNIPKFNLVVQQKNGLLLGEFRALCSINACVVDRDTPLYEDVTITLLNPMTGG